MDVWIIAHSTACDFYKMGSQMWGAPSIDQLPGCGLEVVLRESGGAGMGGVTDQKRFVS